MSLVSYRTRKPQSPGRATVGPVGRAARSAIRSAIEALESRQLLTVTALATPPAVSGGVGTTQTVELTRFASDTAATSHTVRMRFPTGSVDIQTFDTEVPQNVANFLRYVRGGFDNRGYLGSVFHRFVADFVLQGGSFYPDASEVVTTGQPTVPDELAQNTGHDNVRGTLAFARQADNPASATSGFFFNLGENTGNFDQQGNPLNPPNQLGLNYQNGGFDVFGQIVSGANTSGTPAADPVSVIDALSQLQDINRTIDDAVVLEPNVTFTAVSSDPANVQVVNPTDAEGKLGLQFNGAVGSSAMITVTATQAGQPTPVTLQFQATVAAAPSLNVTLGVGGAQTATFTDADGTVGTITIKGPGTATVGFSGTGLAQTARKGRITVTGANTAVATIAVTGTTAKTSVTISGKGGNKTVDVGGLTTDGALSSLSARAASLSGNLSIAGGAAKVDLGSATDSTIGLGGAANGRQPALTFGTLTGTSITSTAPIKSLSATAVASGQATGTISAPSVGSISTRNDFAGNLSLTGGVKKFAVGGNLAGNITAQTIPSLSVKGNVSGATVTVTQPFAGKGRSLGSVKVGGGINNSTFRVSGNVGSVSAQSLSASTIYAGVADSVAATTLPAGVGDFASQATIASVSVRASTAGSNIAAFNLGKLALGQVNTSNGGTLFGLAGDKAAAVTGSLSTGVRFSLKRLDGPADVTAQTQGLTLGDLRINLL